MTEIQICKNCKRALTKDEVGLCRKLFNRGAKSFLCIDCTAAYFNVDRVLLENKIVEFKEMGCTLFSQE